MALGPIIVYDSGVGGLTVARQLMKHCPNHDLIYLADNGWFPYGDKDEKLLVRRVNDLLSILKRQFRPQAIVIACNTAATAIADQLDHRCCVPLYGVTPPIRQAAVECARGKAVLLATPATLQRRMIRELIETYPGRMTTIGTLEMVYLAEQKMARGAGINGTQLVELLEPLIPDSQRREVTTVIFGCTHFPLLRRELSEAFPNAQCWLDPAAETAMAVQRDLSADFTVNGTTSRALLLTSTCRFVELQQIFASEGFAKVLQLNCLFSTPEWRLK